jgi:hypothetical protein
MNCNEATKLFQEYVDGRLFGLDRKDFEDHVAVCPACSAELKEYQALFGMLGDLKPEPAPVWFEETVIRRLKLDGVIYEPDVPWYQKIAIGFNRAPDRVKYPVAALLSALAIYLPVRLFMWLAAGVAGKLAVYASEGYLALQEALKNISVLSRLFDVIATNVKAIITIMGAIFSLLSSAGVIVLPVLGVLIFFTLLVIRHLRNPQRRSQNAPYPF